MFFSHIRIANCVPSSVVHIGRTVTQKVWNCGTKSFNFIQFGLMIVYVHMIYLSSFSKGLLAQTEYVPDICDRNSRFRRYLLLLGVVDGHHHYRHPEESKFPVSYNARTKSFRCRVICILI